jgi:hypothetical protein
MRCYLLIGLAILACCAVLAGCQKSANVSDRREAVGLKKSGTGEEVEAEVQAARAKLNADERRLVDEQDICPISNERLGSMGVPVKVRVQDETVFLCCKSCQKSALEKSDETLVKVKEIKKLVHDRRNH